MTETNVEEGVVNPPTDLRGRPLPEVMSDREILIETLT
jgi:hypothetical protein